MKCSAASATAWRRSRTCASARSFSADAAEYSAAAQQGLARRPFRFRRQRFEELHLAAGVERDRQSVTIQHPIDRQRREPWTGCQNADEVERVGARQRDERAGMRLAPRLAQ